MDMTYIAKLEAETLAAEQLSQYVDATIEFENFDRDTVFDIIEELCLAGHFGLSYVLERRADKVHPGTLKGLDEVIELLEEINDYLYEDVRAHQVVLDNEVKFGNTPCWAK